MSAFFPYRIVIFIALLFFAMLNTATANQEIHFDKDELWIQSSGKSIPFSIELALNKEQRIQGLQGRTDLPLENGMLFYYDYPQMISMWMKNTSIPLDMLFIDQQGIILNIIHQTTPYSEEPLSSKHNVIAVLELRGGAVKQRAIRKGDIVIHSLFGNTHLLNQGL